MISRVWQAQEIKIVYKKYKSCSGFISQSQETGLVHKEADSGALISPGDHKNQSFVEVKALWIHRIHFHIGKHCRDGTQFPA